MRRPPSSSADAAACHWAPEDNHAIEGARSAIRRRSGGDGSQKSSRVSSARAVAPRCTSSASARPISCNVCCRSRASACSRSSRFRCSTSRSRTAASMWQALRRIGGRRCGSQAALDGGIEIGQRQRLVLGANAGVTGRFAGPLALACLGGDLFRPRQRAQLASHHHRELAAGGPEFGMAGNALQPGLELLALRSAGGPVRRVPARARLARR